MTKIEKLLREIVNNEKLIEGVLSNLRRKDKKTYKRVRIHPVLIKGEYLIQFTYEYEEKVYHENLSKKEGIDKLNFLFYEVFRQGNIFTEDKDYEILVSKKRKVRITDKVATKKLDTLSHNRKKNHILQEDGNYNFLKRLGVMDKEGRVLPSRYDKFRQINRFLELVEDVIPKLKDLDEINIVDFGCGKSYLTFALYHYFVEILNLNINIIGLDLKEDVINFCNKVANDLDYKDLKFYQGDIKDFEKINEVDMVVTLHACDIATDAALVKAIDWRAKVILSVPCCQSEFYSKLENEDLEPMLKHGIIRERLATLVTDSLRGQVLEIANYQVQLLEFIDMEHTAKNILIRAYLEEPKSRNKEIEEYLTFKKAWNLKDLFIEEELTRLGIDLGI